MRSMLILRNRLYEVQRKEVGIALFVSAFAQREVNSKSGGADIVCDVVPI